GERRDATGAIVDGIRLTDRFFLGEPQMRGFDIRGVGPRVVRRYYTATTANGVTTGAETTGSNNRTDDALGGKAYYMARAEVEIPLGSGAREMGLRPSIFMDVGAVGGLKSPGLINGNGQFAGYCSATGLTTIKATGTAASPVCPANYTAVSDFAVSSGFVEEYLGDTLKPRLSVGFGVNWNSPFGPFRIDIAKALLKEPGDDTKLITFNVGTQF
ncbi:MAG: BamA/TamA family outer membrane protein, partial [bacterium]|nr:BamA/TamA family outer membrane protein [bacterium]